MPSTLKTIGEYAFNDCGNLKKIELPASLDSIGDYAFYSLGNLSSVISRIQHPFNINQNAFCLGWDWDYSSGTEKQVFRKSSATLYVPDNTMSSYQAIDGWNMFADIIEGELMEGKYEDLYYSYIKGKGKATVINGDYSNLRKVTVPSTAILDGDSYNVTAISA